MLIDKIRKGSFTQVRTLRFECVLPYLNSVYYFHRPEDRPTKVNFGNFEGWPASVTKFELALKLVDGHRIAEDYWDSFHKPVSQRETVI